MALCKNASNWFFSPTTFPKLDVIIHIGLIMAVGEALASQAIGEGVRPRQYQNDENSRKETFPVFFSFQHPAKLRRGQL